jgi:hypothetical protein
MKRTVTVGAVALAVLAWAGSLQAHHSGSMYETVPIWVKGTVLRFEGINPHTITTVENRNADGQVRRWAIEGPGQFQLGRLGLGVNVPKVGDFIEFCAFPYKSAAELSRRFPGADFSKRRSSTDVDGSPLTFVAGHVMVMPDGEKRLWEPHGVISECIRISENQGQSWLDFLDSSPRARQAWCEQMKYTRNQSSAATSQLEEEINSLIDDPCE